MLQVNVSPQSQRNGGRATPCQTRWLSKDCRKIRKRMPKVIPAEGDKEAEKKIMAEIKHVGQMKGSGKKVAQS